MNERCRRCYCYCGPHDEIKTPEMESNRHTDSIDFSHAAILVTTPSNYSETRIALLLELDENRDAVYSIVRGEHCSCFGWDDVRWDVTRYYCKQDVLKVMDGWEKSVSLDSRLEQQAAALIKAYLR